MPVYEVGMGSDKRKVEASSAAAAALYYGIMLVRTNNPFMTAVYTEDGQEYTGEKFWMNLVLSEEFIVETFERIGLENIRQARLVE